jgi:Tfp pilus assembly protein PilP
MNRKLNIRSITFLFVLSLFGLLSFQVPAQSENLELDSLKANFPPGERYFSLGKRDPFVPLVGPNKKGFKKVSSQPFPSKKKRLIKLDKPSKMPLIPIKVYEKVKEEYPRMADRLRFFASIFNDESKLRKMSDKKYRRKVSRYRSLLSEVLGMQEKMFMRTELLTDFDKMKLVGTLRREGTTVALVQTEGQKGHTVKVGTLIGPNLGIVKTVDEKKIVVLERYRNYLGEILSRVRNIEFKKNQLQG